MADDSSTITAAIDGRQRTSASRRLFAVAVSARLLLIAVLCLSPRSMLKDLSNDSAKYHNRGQVIADQYSRGEIDWAGWVDDGWYQLVGLVYFMFGPHMLVVMVINCVLAGLATVLIYRIALEAFGDEPVARVSAYIFALFPSILYYTAMPLKEAASLFGVLSVAWGVMSLISRRDQFGYTWIVVGLAVLAALRVYLSVVVGGCALICLAPLRIPRGWWGLTHVGLIGLAGVVVAVFAVQASGVDSAQHEYLRYFDLDYINHVRGSLSRGNARMFQDANQAAWGQDWSNDAILAAKGAYYFLFSVDVTNINRARQLAAIPEVLFFLYCVPYIWAGFWSGWNRSQRKTLPVVLFAVVIAGVFASAATNMGALYRWRAQALPFVIMLIVYGAAVRDRGILSRVLRRIRGAMQVRAARVLAIASR